MDIRTIRAAILAFLLPLVGFAAVGVFLGFGVAPSLAAGIVLGALSGALILAVAQRADGMTPPDPETHDG